MTRLVRALLAGLLMIAATLTGWPAGAVDQDRGYAGFCRSDKGVTVVIDFQKLGGKTIVRCNPTGKRGTGLDALKGAGIQVAGVQRWGEAFICRIENRPSAVETLPIKGNTGYRESCIDTPPAAGYWSYWHAGNNCSWKYSQWGVKNRDFVPGGFEGWSFSLNATAETNPRPRIAAVRPGTKGGQCVEPEEFEPATNDPFEKQPGSTDENGYVPDADYGKDADGSDEVEEKGSAASKDLPAPKPRDRLLAADPEDNVEYTGGEEAPDVNDVIKKQAHASDYAPWVAGGVIVILIVLALWTSHRRRQVRLDL